MFKNTTCQYIGSTALHTGSCNCVTAHNSSYCESHHNMIYQAGTARAKRHKDIRTANAIWDWQSEFNEAVLELEAEDSL
jgi:hypothetical protein